MEKPLDTAKQHFYEWGIYEGRNRHCAPRLSDQQAKCYLDRYPDLQQAFGDSWIKVREHWYEYGFKEGRVAACEEAATPVKCADEGGVCNCPSGLVFFGKKYDTSHEQRGEQASFEQILQWGYSQVKPINGQMNCDYRLIGDPHPGFPKQCFCEPKPIQKPEFCANEGEDCMCPQGANLFFGTKAVEGNPNAKFSEMIQQPYAHKIKKNPDNRPAKCTVANFKGDPLPGISKQCYCDGDKTYS